MKRAAAKRSPSPAARSLAASSRFGATDGGRASKSTSRDRDKDAVAGQVRHIFARFDANGDGKIDREELVRVFQQLDPAAWPVSKINRMFEAADVNRDNYIDYNELFDWVFKTGNLQETFSKSMELAAPKSADKSLALTVSLLGGAETTVNAAGQETIAQVLVQLAKQFDVKASELSLLRAGCFELLPSNKSLKECGICDSITRLVAVIGEDPIVKEVREEVGTYGMAGAEERLRARCEHLRKIGQQFNVDANMIADVNHDLEMAAPCLEASLHALNAVCKADLDELKHLRKPTPLVQSVGEAMCLAFGEKPSWENAVRLLKRPTILRLMTTYDKDGVADGLLKQLNRFIANPEFVPEQVKCSSAGAAKLCSCVRALDVYCRIRRATDPKKKVLKEIQEQLEAFDTERSRLHALSAEFCKQAANAGIEGIVFPYITRPGDSELCECLLKHVG